MRTILVLNDTMRRDYLPPYCRSENVIAPNFEAFSKDAVTFDSHYVGSLPCMPARRDLLCGRLNFLERSWGAIEAFDKTFPKILNENHIRSHIITDHAHYFGIGGENYCSQYNTYEFFRGQESDPWVSLIDDPVMPAEYFGVVKRQVECNRTRICRENDYPSVQTFNAAIEWVKTNHKAKDFFLQVETFDPHEPFDVPNKYLKMYDDTYEGPRFDLPKYHKIDVETEEALKHLNNRYKALITMTDYHFGKFIQALKDNGLYEDAMIIVTTDHGNCMAERGYLGKNYMHSYDEIARIPLMIHMPGNIGAGTSRTALTQTIDLAPTILEMNGCSIPSSMTGKSLKPVIAADSRIHDSVLYGSFGATVNLCDNAYTYFRAPRNNNLCYEYTSSLTTLRNWIGTENTDDVKTGYYLKNADIPVYRIHQLKNPLFSSIDEMKNDCLFDIVHDPEQKNNMINHKELVQKYERMLIENLKANNSPLEQFPRLGLAEEKK